jgi:hypothetical protein
VKLPLTIWCLVLLGKPAVAQPLKKFPAFYGTGRFTAVFTRASEERWRN